MYALSMIHSLRRYPHASATDLGCDTNGVTFYRIKKMEGPNVSSI